MARPSLRGEPADRVVAFRVTSPEWAFITRIATANQMSVGELLAAAVNEYAVELGEGEGLPRSLTVCQSLVVPTN